MEPVLLMTGGSFVLGIVNGMLIGLLAVGIVLVYRSNRLLNLAHAQLGVLSTQLLGKFVLDWGWNWWAAFLVCLPVGMAIGAVVDHYLVRPLRERSASTVSLLLVTLGVSQLLLVFTYIPVFGPSQNKLYTTGYPQPFRSSVTVGGVVLSGADILTVLVVPAAVIALGLFLRYSLLGKTMRAAASNPEEARLCGASTRRVSLITWGIAGAVSALAGILQAPTQSAFDAAALGPYLLLLSLGAAALGAFVSIPMALAGGLLIGVVDQLVLAGTSNAGDGELAVFALIVVIVLARGPAIGRVFAAGGSVSEDRAPLRVPAALRDHPVVRYQRSLPIAVCLGLALLLPLMPVFRSQGDRFQLALILLYVVVGVSLTVAIGWAGQVSLGQFALVGIGAFTAGHLLNRGWTLPFLVIVCGLVAAAFMVVVGLPALRVPGLTLAVTTLGLAVVGPDWLFHQTWMGSSSPSGLDVNAPALARGLGHPSDQLAVYYFCLAVVVAACAAMWSLRRSGPGRLIVAVRDNEAAAAAFGVTPASVKLAALSVSGFLAGAAGVMWADCWRTVNPNQFTPDVSISVLAIPVIGGVGSVGGAVAAAAILYGFTIFLSPHLGAVFPSGNAGVASVLLFGGLSLVLVLHRYPQGLAHSVQSWWQKRLERMAATTADSTPHGDTAALRVEELVLAFGGLRALDGASIEVQPGEIVGLIGPNGAGKTTLLNAVSGRLKAQSGRVLLMGVEVTDMEPEMRAACGLSRSFQDAHLFPGLTVLETVQIASANRWKVGVLSSALGAPWGRASEVRSRKEAQAVIDRLGLGDWAGALTSELSTGTRRICDLAAQVAARPRVLLLDEPTAGVAQREAEAFGPLLRRIRDELDCAIVIVEHDMPLLMGLCDRIYAMEQGQVIASGSPAEIRANPAVIASYLGTDEAAITRSGRGRKKVLAKAATGAKASTRVRTPRKVTDA
ncbi:MAG TPA: ATP-binding cassette domain-containing protein [Acidimicrobiales bacterium]|nr:ATP-binding cassette domain-containing protein [Acidimicrobiales bacterium]